MSRGASTVEHTYTHDNNSSNQISSVLGTLSMSAKMLVFALWSIISWLRLQSCVGEAPQWGASTSMTCIQRTFQNCKAMKTRELRILSVSTGYVLVSNLFQTTKKKLTSYHRLTTMSSALEAALWGASPTHLWSRNEEMTDHCARTSSFAPLYNGNTTKFNSIFNATHRVFVT